MQILELFYIISVPITCSKGQSDRVKVMKKRLELTTATLRNIDIINPLNAKVAMT